MNLLLDTHVFLWYIAADPRLPTAWTEQIRSPVSRVYVSVVSIWESIIKHQLGKLVLPEPPEIYLPRQRERHRFESLVVDEASVSQVASLPAHHKDPFDRLLIGQGLAHELTLVTIDAAMASYTVKRLPRA